jgi:LysM repeat protein
MSERGEAVGAAPGACPFVALELDRDRRSDKPDYRHRCFAEPTPQPRAISHQAAYCLSPNFPGCPIFQDWAVRAAAQPTATAGGAAAAVSTDIPPELPAAGEDWPAEAFAPAEQPDAAEQLSVFTTPVPEPTAPGPETPEPPPLESVPQYARPDPVAQPQPTDAPVPGFLAGRPERPPRSSRPAEHQETADFYEPAASHQPAARPEKVSREELIPSWERDGRFGAEPAERERTDRFGGIVTAIAVVIILGLGVAGVIFLPGLLAGGGPSRTPTPQPSSLPSGGAVLPSSLVTPLMTLTPSPTPDVTAAPTPTPHIYRVRRGDSLGGIARKFRITVADLMAANPQITNPDHIEPGDLLTIPPPPGSLPTAEPSPAP